MRLARLSAALTTLICAIALAGPAAAQSQEQLRKLSEIYKLIKNDETAKAVEQINTLLEEAPERSGTASKALLLRGQAYAKAGQNTRALSDFNAALWLKGLNASQRKDAIAGRKAALAELGLAEEDATEETAEAETSSRPTSIPTSIPTSTDDAEPAASRASAPASPAPSESASPETSGDSRPSNAPATAAWQTEVQAAEPEPDNGGGIGGFFSDLFGGGSEEPEPAPSQEADTAVASGWSASTTDTAATTASASGEGGRHRVQLASVGTRDGAESEVDRLSRLLGDALQGETPKILRADTDAGNTYYRIVVGPKPSRDAASGLCETFKSRGVDCLVVSSR